MTTLKVLSEFKIASQPGNEREAMDLVAGAVTGLNLPAEIVERLKTAVAEATMNAMEHGNRYQSNLPVEVEVIVSEAGADSRDLIIRVRDFGGSRQVPASEMPDLEAKLAGRQSPRGWGLFLIKNMVDEMHVTSDEIYHTIELVLHLRGVVYMAESTLTARVRSQPHLAIIDLDGGINALSEETLYQAYGKAEQVDPKTILLNLTRVGYINSTGIALIVGLLSKARESQRKLGIYGLTDHYWEIFRITRLAEYMGIYPDEASALQAAQSAS